VTGIGTADAVAVVVGVADTVAVAVATGVADPVAVSVGVGVITGVAVGVGLEHKAKSVVQAAPSEGQQKLEDPQNAIVPTLAIVAQLISRDASPLATE